jgi:hypothetical protein
MGQQQVGDDPRVKWQDSVFFRAFPAAALKHAAVHQNTVTIGGQKMHRTGYFPYRPVKRHVHETPPLQASLPDAALSRVMAFRAVAQIPFRVF